MNAEALISPMPEFLASLSHRLVVVGSVARTIRSSGYTQPKDLDLLCDLDSDRARQEIKKSIAHYELKFESPFIACWSFRDYGWMVEILGIHRGPFYSVVRRRAERMIVEGVELWVARAIDA